MSVRHLCVWNHIYTMCYVFRYPFSGLWWWPPSLKSLPFCSCPTSWFRGRC
uniref:Uncharacterized protein n=1 Tax=Anguilla anguilla TaxID=7936 RepID=A0A0E9U262_ANGAN